MNLIGCVLFAVSAVAAYAVPSSGSEISVAAVNITTAAGALGFLIGSLLLLPEGNRAPSSAAPLIREA